MSDAGPLSLPGLRARLVRQPAGDRAQERYSRLFQESHVARTVYEHLKILDSKASALLRFNGIAIAILVLITIGQEVATSEGDVWGWARLTAWGAALVSLALFMASTFACHLVVHLHWYDPEDLRRLVRYERERAAEGRDALLEPAAPRPLEAEERLSLGGGFGKVVSRSILYTLSHWLAIAATAPLAVALALVLWASAPPAP